MSNLKYNSFTEHLVALREEQGWEYLRGRKLPFDIVNSKTGDVAIVKNRKITKTLLDKVIKGLEEGEQYHIAQYFSLLNFVVSLLKKHQEKVDIKRSEFDYA